MRSKFAFVALGIASVAISASAGDLMASPVSVQDVNSTATLQLRSNDDFVSSKDSSGAAKPFSGHLAFAEANMESGDKLAPVNGKDLHAFPAFEISFTTVESTLVPSSQEILGDFKPTGAGTYWQILVQPGKVWSEPGDPPGWTRASFPLALMNPVEGGESHNGVALFMYKDVDVTPLHVQITTGTTPFQAGAVFKATATSVSAMKPISATEADSIKKAFNLREAGRLPVKSWDSLPVSLTSAQSAEFGGRMRDDWKVATAVFVDGTIYMKSCQTSEGPLPYCDRQRFGVWSATKSAVARMAMLRMAAKYGDQIFTMKIGDLLPEAKRFPAWKDVTLGSALNMATGVGKGAGKPEANIGDEPYDDSYMAFYNDGDFKSKLEKALARPRSYGWGIDKFVRYRDEDYFILGAALDSLLKDKEGADKDIASMLRHEVYENIKVYDLPVATTFGVKRQPLAFEGLYATIDDLVKIAKLFQGGGAVAGNQLLSQQKTQEGLTNHKKWGLPTGRPRGSGERYFSSFWIDDFSFDGCDGNFARFMGYGGQIVAMLPNNLIAVRLSSAPTDDETVSDFSGLAQASNAIAKVCNN
ncbi:class C beta-lactamase-related serine hydrolase [Mesorhizobium sp. M7A.F.Ca.US.011.01.1.1]|uniref:serine hydrolase n=1 Tax=Mesorhizobium sp. M7A.F.Ca.US.011.01.1.1 TaxID=2496741 RepID=UPI000FCB51CD|nr:serine hydrolase [Mesorhizobium sp. M7A.F.Ca.US.011.01.1.1]RUX23735.1 class C beta-lactamase-related serine hydrolase [Mesorhizobium sp. M7A.F.Ca.US.011.01.1.1]